MSARTRIKICGVTTVDDALAIADAGVDAIGLVFTECSPRCIGIQRGLEICEALPPFVTTVALFMDDGAPLLREVLSHVGPAVLQFHGSEAPAECARWSRPYIKAVPMGESAGSRRYMADYPDAGAFLLDANRIGERGGLGATFDWKRVPLDAPAPIILAGGLRAENVAAAVVQVRPFAVDVSSGVELERGVKDLQQVRRFVLEVRSADSR